MSEFGKFLRIGISALAIEAATVGVYSISQPRFVQVLQEEAQAADLDFSILEENLDELVGQEVSVSGWPEFVKMEYIRPVGSTDVPTPVDIYRLLEEPGKKSPLYFFDPHKMAGGDPEVARKRYRDTKVSLKGRIVADIYGIGIGPHLEIAEDPQLIAALPHFHNKE